MTYRKIIRHIEGKDEKGSSGRLRPEVQGSVQGMPCLMIRCNISQ